MLNKKKKCQCLASCNHSLDDLRESTLVRLPKRVMVHPETKYYFCKVCKQVITFTGNEEEVNSEDNNIESEEPLRL